MNKEITKNIRLGFFVITGTVLLIMALYFIGSNSNLFSKTFKLYATFSNVNGLKEGNNVRYAGIDVGTIKNIKIINDTTIRVEMSVEADLKKVIRKNSTVSIGTDGLMGNKLVIITPGTFGKAPVEDNDLIATAQPISIDAIEQIQVNISPYDVRQGSFSGAGINSVTRSGTNKFKGSVYGFSRSENTQGYKVNTAEAVKTNIRLYLFECFRN